MRLDRNTNDTRRGKYALLKLRRLDDFADPADPFQTVDPKIADAIKTLESAGILDWGQAGTESEFFVIRLKDRYAQAALCAYHSAIVRDAPVDEDYARDVIDLALRAGPQSPWCKLPD